MEAKGSGKKCLSVPGMDFEPILEGCLEDIQVIMSLSNVIAAVCLGWCSSRPECDFEHYLDLL